MDYDMAYAAFNGRLPQDMRDALFYGSYRMMRHQKIVAIYLAQQKRCADIRASLCAWHAAPYDIDMKRRMLDLLSGALHMARCRADNVYRRIAE